MIALAHPAVLFLQVKGNFERFISCKSTIDDIHVRLRKAEGDYGDSADGASTADMVAAVTDVSPSCKAAICAHAVNQNLFASSGDQLQSCKSGAVGCMQHGTKCTCLASAHLPPHCFHHKLCTKLTTT